MHNYIPRWAFCKKLKFSFRIDGLMQSFNKKIKEIVSKSTRVSDTSTRLVESM